MNPSATQPPSSLQSSTNTLQASVGSLSDFLNHQPPQTITMQIQQQQSRHAVNSSVNQQPQQFSMCPGSKNQQQAAIPSSPQTTCSPGFTHQQPSPMYPYMQDQNDSYNIPSQPTVSGLQHGGMVQHFGGSMSSQQQMMAAPASSFDQQILQQGAFAQQAPPSLGHSVPPNQNEMLRHPSGGQNIAPSSQIRGQPQQGGQMNQSRFPGPRMMPPIPTDLPPSKPKKKSKPKPKKPPQPKDGPKPDPLALVAPPGVTSVPPVPKPKSRKKSTPGNQQASAKKLTPAQIKAQEEEAKYSRKYQLLKRCVKALVFKNAALCDEVARLNQRIHTVTEERKVLLKRIFHHERLKQKKIQNAQKRQAAAAEKIKAETAAMAQESSSTSNVSAAIVF